MMTVSRVMHNAESVRPATRDRVLQAIQTLNYVPDLSARKMRAQGRKPSTLAVLAQDTATTPFSVDILLAIEQTASEFGWNSFLINIFSEDDDGNCSCLQIDIFPGQGDQFTVTHSCVHSQ